MQPTERFYQADPYRTEAGSVILAAEPAEGGGGRIALAGTVFYPEGGGQPADRGALTLPDGAALAVADVHEKDGVIWHTVDALPAAARPGTPVHAASDWAWRFDKMQQHTGEHILSGTLHRLFGAENVPSPPGSEPVRTAPRRPPTPPRPRPPRPSRRAAAGVRRNGSPPRPAAARPEDNGTTGPCPRRRCARRGVPARGA